MKTTLVLLSQLLFSSCALAQYGQLIQEIELSTHKWQSYASACGGTDVTIKLSNPRTINNPNGQACIVQRSGGFEGGDIITWKNGYSQRGLNLNDCGNFYVDRSTMVQVMTNTDNQYCPDIVTIVKSNGVKFESKMKEQRYSSRQNQMKHPVERTGISRIILNMAPCTHTNVHSSYCEGHHIKIRIHTGNFYCTVATKARVSPNELVVWEKEELRNCAIAAITDQTIVHLITDSTNDPFMVKDLEIYMNDLLYTNWRVRIGERRYNLFAKNWWWSEQNININTNNNQLTVSKIWPRDDYIQPARDRPLTCPSNEDSCPVADMYAYRLKSNLAMNCIFECGMVNSTPFSTSLDVTDGTGHRCMAVNYPSKQYEWCCRTKATRGGIPHCDDALAPHEEPVVNSIPTQCSNHGCPVQMVEGRPAPGRTMRSCTPGCPKIYDESNLRCTQLIHEIPNTQFCCNNQYSNTTLPQCSSLNESGDDGSDYDQGEGSNQNNGNSGGSGSTLDCTRAIMTNRDHQFYNQCWEQWQRNRN